jgi:hypothetical protein
MMIQNSVTNGVYMLLALARTLRAEFGGKIARPKTLISCL